MNERNFSEIADNLTGQLQALGNEIYRLQNQVKNNHDLIEKLERIADCSREREPNVSSKLKYLEIQCRNIVEEVALVAKGLENIERWKATREGQISVWVFLANGIGIGSILLHFFHKVQ